MMINLIITKMEREHLSSLAELEKICFSQPWSYKSLEDELENETAHFFVASVDNEVAGYIGMYIVCDNCFVTNIAVFPRFRRQGIAKALIKMALLTNDAMETDFISLEVRKSNEPAIALYKSFGFEQNGLRKNYYKNPTEDALIMTKFFRRNG